MNTHIIVFDAESSKGFKEFEKVKETTSHGELYFVGNLAGEIYHSAFCYPIALKDRLIEILTIREKLKKDLDESIKLLYALRKVT